MDDFDFEGIAHLVQNGFHLQQALELLKTEKNKETVDAITRHLDQGRPITEFFADYCPRKTRMYMEGFLHVLPLSDALSLCLTLIHQREEQNRTLSSALLYPLLLFLCTTLGVLIFRNTVYPSLVSMMNGFHVESDSGFVLLLINVYLYLVLVIGLLCISSILLLSEGRRLTLFLKLYERHPDNLVSKILSLHFVQLVIPCLKMGLGTKEWVTILKHMKNTLFMAHILDELEIKLETGATLSDAILSCPMDPLLLRTIHIASYSSDMEKMLQEYTSISTMRLNARLRHITTVLQMISYVLIGFVLILIYQILMLPMLVLTQF